MTNSIEAKIASDRKERHAANLRRLENAPATHWARCSMGEHSWECVADDGTVADHTCRDCGAPSSHQYRPTSGL